MAVASAVIMMVLSTSVLQVYGSDFLQFYPLQKTLETALTRDETLYTMKQVFFPVKQIHSQEVDQVRINVCVEITVDPTLNSTTNDSCRASDYKTSGSKINVCSLQWRFVWTDSALLSLITIDQLVAFEVLAGAVYRTTTGPLYYFTASLAIVCPVMLNKSDIITPLMLLLSWSKSYARHHGVPSQWEETDKGYIQELYDHNYVAESPFNEDSVHSIHLGMIISFILMNVLVLIGILSYGKQCYMKIHQTTTRLAVVVWAFMITALLMNCFYLLYTIYGFATFHPRVVACLVSEADWCSPMKSTMLYSDEVISLLAKLTVIPFTIVVELIIAVRLTRHTLLPFPCTMATRSQCSFRNVKRVVEIILIWNVMAFMQIIFGSVLLPISILMVIAPVLTFSFVSTCLVVPFAITGFIAYFILRWYNPFSFKHCYSVYLCAHILTTVVISSLLLNSLFLYYSSVFHGVEPWSVKGSILSLLPSFLVSPLLWLAKKYFFKKKSIGRGGTNSIFLTAQNQFV